jgi:hypothetical protein
MLKLDKVGVTPETLANVEKILRDSFGVEEGLEGIYSMSGGGVNDANHRVAITKSGRRFGIKAQARGGGPEGEKREVAFSNICHALGITEASRAIHIEGVPGLAGFEASSCVVTEWVPDGKRPSEITTEEKKELEADVVRVAEQLGKWIAVDLHLGLADRGKLDNWAWSQQHRRLAAIDTESAFQNATVADHKTIVDAFYGAPKIKAERGVSVAAQSFESAVRSTHKLIQSRASDIQSALADLPSAKNYASPYAGLDEDRFIEKIFSEIA